jgi:hypothetical protein
VERVKTLFFCFTHARENRKGNQEWLIQRHNQQWTQDTKRQRGCPEIAGAFVDRIYPIELEKKDTTDTDMSASYLDLHLEIDSEDRLRTKLYDKRDDFNFPIVVCRLSVEKHVHQT